MAYFCVDFENTRSQGIADITSATMLHVHGVMLVRPRHLPKFNSRIEELRIPIKVPTIKDVVIQNYDPARCSLEDVISYCFKGYTQTPNSYSAKDDMWAIFPR